MFAMVLPSLARDIRFRQSAQIADEHLVACTEHDGRIIVVRLHVCGKASGAKIPREQTVAGAFRPPREFLAQDILRDFEGQRVARPDMPDDAANGFLHPEIRRMIVATVNNRNARVTVHEELKNLIAIWSNSGVAQSLFNERSDHGYRLRPANQRIFELARVHLH
jgi:hypothetical protein